MGLELLLKMKSIFANYKNVMQHFRVFGAISVGMPNLWPTMQGSTAFLL